jgi:FkbM family methyltransferase
MIIAKLKNNLRKINNERNQKRLLNKKCVMLNHGFLFSGRSQYFSKFGYEPYQTELITRLLKHVSLFINIGAHHGYYCCLAIKQGIPVVAFEPHPMNIAMLKKHINANDYMKSFTLFEAAVGADESRLRFFGSGFTGSLLKIHKNVPSEEFQDVDVVSLNNKVNLENTKALILMDIEGFEIQALRGATELMKHKPYWIIEILNSENGIPFSDVFTFMSQYGYEAWGINESSKKITKMTIDRAKRVDRNEEKIDCTNFIFAHKSELTIEKIM